MTKGDRLPPFAAGLVRTARVGNVLLGVLILLVIVASYAAEPRLIARLTAKYGAGADVPAILTYMRLVMLVVVPAMIVVERLLKALGAILANVGAGEPFAPANGAHLRTIGWMLLALQLLDLALGASTIFAVRLQVDVLDWQPSFTGWFAVLVAFVLVRVFAAGTELREELDGTV